MLICHGLTNGHENGSSETDDNISSRFPDWNFYFRKNWRQNGITIPIGLFTLGMPWCRKKKNGKPANKIHDEMPPIDRDTEKTNKEAQVVRKKNLFCYNIIVRRSCMNSFVHLAGELLNINC